MPNDYEQFLKQGDHLANQGKFDEALEQYVQARGADPSRPEARKQIINMAVKKEDFKTAFREYLDWASRLKSGGKAGEALKVLQEALSLESQYEKRGFLQDRRGRASAKMHEQFQQVSGEFFESMGEIHREQKDYNNAIDCFLKALEITPNDTKALCFLGMTYLSKGLLDKAKGPFQEVVRFQGPETPVAYEKLAEIYSSQGNSAQMLIWLKEAADAYIKKNEWEEAAGVLEKIAQIDAGNKEVLTRLGEIYAKQNRMAEAVGVYKKLSELYAQAGIFDKVMVLYEKLAEWAPEDSEIVERAVEIYRSGLKMDPGNLRARIKLIENLIRKGAAEEVVGEYLLLVDDYIRMGLQDEAVVCCEKILEFEPGSVRAREKLAELYLKTGKSEEAGKQFITIAENLGEGEQERSAELIHKAMGLVREKSDVHLVLAGDLLKRGMKPEALEEFEKVLRSQPDHLEALMQAGRLWMEKNQWETAEQRFLHLLDVDSKQREARERLVEIYENRLLREMEEPSLLAG